MTAVAQIVQFTPEELTGLLRDAAAEGARIALQQTSRQPKKPIPTQEAMKLTGYKDPEYYRKWCKHHGISPVSTRCRTNFWQPEELENAMARTPKNARKK